MKAHSLFWKNTKKTGFYSIAGKNNEPLLGRYENILNKTIYEQLNVFSLVNQKLYSFLKKYLTNQTHCSIIIYVQQEIAEF